MGKLNEHLWSGIIHRSETGEVRKEDHLIIVKDKEELRKQLQKIIDKIHPKQGETIFLNNFVVDDVEDMSWLFSKYNNQDGYDFTDYNFEISDWNVSNVRNMREMFYECKYFNCDISNWDVSNVENMEGIFQGCERFNCDLSNWDTDSLIGDTMYCMFDGCDSLEKLPDWWSEGDLEDEDRE